MVDSVRAAQDRAAQTGLQRVLDGTQPPNGRVRELLRSPVLAICLRHDGGEEGTVAYSKPDGPGTVVTVPGVYTTMDHFRCL